MRHAYFTAVALTTGDDLLTGSGGPPGVYYSHTLTDYRFVLLDGQEVVAEFPYAPVTQEVGWIIETAVGGLDVVRADD